jgi:hypothetical protein
VGRAVIAAVPTQQTNDMLTALILICSATLTPDLHDCTRVQRDRGHARTRRVRKSAYLLHAWAGVPCRKSIGQELGGDDRIKIVCARSNTIDASVKPAKIR